MNRRFQTHLFWGTQAPLAVLTGGGLLLMASSRLAFALVVCGALVWVYGLSTGCAHFLKPWFPRRGKYITLIFLSAFSGSLYLLLLFLVNPMLAMGTAFLILLAPPCCIGSGVVFRFDSAEPAEALFRAFWEALALGGLILALALIREPLGFAALSLPGGVRGIVEIFNAEGEGFFPVRIISASSGGLLLLGYAAALFYRQRSRYVNSEESP
jgi:subtilisin family serine protease